METVFDYNITDKEREDIGISDKERYLAIVGEDTANLDLATLFHTRGDNNRMTRYADKVGFLSDGYAPLMFLSVSANSLEDILRFLTSSFAVFKSYLLFA